MSGCLKCLERDTAIIRLQTTIKRLQQQSQKLHTLLHESQDETDKQKEIVKLQKLVIHQRYEGYVPDLERLKASLPLVGKICVKRIKQTPNGCCTKQELFDAVREQVPQWRLANTTVYRNIEMLADPKHTDGNPLLKRHGTKAALYSLAPLKPPKVTTLTTYRRKEDA